MSKRRICLVMAVLVAGVGPAASAAVTDGLTGLWEFNDAGNLVKATVGNDLVLNGTGQSVVTGISGSDGAVGIESGTYYQCAHGIAPNGGGSYVNEFTLLFDVMYPQPSEGQWRCFFQTNTANTNDGDYFIHPTDESWGVAAIGYTDNATVGQWQSTHSTWYRAVMTVNLDDNPDAAFFNLYINGELKGKHSTSNLGLDGRFSLYSTNDPNPYILLACDNDGEDALMYFSNIAIWDRPLTGEEVAELGGPGDAIEPRNIAPASDPRPADGESDVCTDIALQWTPGAYAPSANGHRVFFGENVDDVTNGAPAADRGTVNDPQYDPGVLDYETTYYWRIDEANATTIWDKGGVWSFTTEPYAYPIAGSSITATASGSTQSSTPDKTIDGSGLDENGLHSTVTTGMWLSDSSSPGQAWIQYEFDQLYKLHEILIWNYNGEGLNTAFGIKEVTIEHSQDGQTWTPLTVPDELTRASGAAGYAANTTVDADGVVAKYVRITADGNWSGGLVDQYGLSEVQFYYLPMRARSPAPSDGESDVPIDVTLNWRAGREAATQKLYFGPEPQAVALGIVEPIVVPGGACGSTYGPLSLRLDTAYYWKVVEVNEAAEPSVWDGPIWSFRTSDSRLVDDFNTYGDNTVPGQPGSRVWYVWRDGEGWNTPSPGSAGNGTGSVVDLGSGPSLGGGALVLHYDNDGTNLLGTSNKDLYSEVTASVSDLKIGSDWTKGQAKALSINFFGDPGNAAGATEQMYVKINGVKVPYDGPMSDLQEAEWHQWLIDLASFGVDLHSVTSISIGFGDENNTTVPGGSGTAIFDEIRLYRGKPVLGNRTVDFAKADVVPDCVIDLKDVAVMAGNWLVASTPPGMNGLIGWWKFDGNADDSSGSGINGAVMGNVAWVSGQIDDALELGGNGNADVVLGSATDLNFGETTDFTVALWTRTTGWQNDAALISNKDWDSGSNTGWVIAGQSGGQGSWQWNYKGETGPRRDYDPSGPLLSDGQWHHLCVSHDRDGYAKFYFDGQFQAQVDISASTGTLDSTYPTVVGTDGAEGFVWPYWYQGAIDDVRIYDRVLADHEVKYLSGIRGDVNTDNEVNFLDLAGMLDLWHTEQLWP